MYLEFKTWLETRIFESTNIIEWQRLYQYLLTYYKAGPFENPQFHAQAVRLLRNVGMDEEANDLEMVRISDDDIALNKQTGGYGLGATIGDVLKYKNERERQELLSAAIRTYRQHIEAIMDRVEERVEQMGWDINKWE